MISLKEITKHNYDEIIQLGVHEHQKSFVSSISDSLAQAWVYRETAYPFAIYDNTTPIGFVMLGYYESRGQYTLWKFLIDKNFQNKGYGKQALQLAVNYLINSFDAKEIYTGVLIENERAKDLYTSFGFVETGVIEDNMIELKYICKSNHTTFGRS